MTRTKTSELKNISKEDRQKKIGELKMELVKSKAAGSKAGSSKTKEIKRLIARLLTLDTLNKGEK